MKILIIALLSLITYDAYSACAPGAVPCENAGIENFKVQTVDPTFTASPGEKGLFNTNSQFKTKDEFGNIARLVPDPNNAVSNFDTEEGLTGFTFTGALATVNTTTPLANLKSINFDSVAQNDFLETNLITIPRSMMGNSCMISVLVKGGDANLQLQAVNGAGTIIGLTQLTTYADASYQSITFGCPTQAAITGTPALGQIKIKVVQSTAVNAALATLDNFYLGAFTANRIAVQDGSQWYYYTANADINGNFTFPAPTASTNDKTLFTYAGTTLTALKPIKLDAEASIRQLQGGAGCQGDYLLTCTISGITRTLSSINPWVASGTSQCSGSIISNVNLLPGDTCSFSFTRASATISNHTVNITATPLPSLASIVTSPNLPAGFYGSKSWAATAGCTWTKGAGMGDFPAVAACGPAVSQQGLAIADAASNGQLPQIRFNKMPKGIYKFTLTGDSYSPLGGGGVYQISNGTYSSLSTGRNANSNSANDVPTIVFYVIIPIDLTDPTFKVQANGVSGSVSINAANNASSFSIAVSYEPDLSNPYNQSMVAVLPPQVINSSGKAWRTESCLVLNPAGTASLGSPGCSNWISSVSRYGLGLVQVNITPGIFSSLPDCQCTVAGISGRWCRYGNTAPTGNTYYFAIQDQTVYGDANFTLNCQGFN